MLGFLPPGSRWRKDLMEFRTTAFFRQPATLPVELGPR
jgi:hypothetical protein